jgi:peptidyl-prolyl cis-trans isomerase SurA
MRAKSLIVGMFFFVAGIAHLYAQPKIIDEVIAIVGNNVILLSDIEKQYQQMRAQGYYSPGDMKCEVLEDFLAQKLLVNQARIDSIEVSPATVEMQLDQRLSYFIEQIGSQEELEEYFNKSIFEIKDDLRESVKEQLITQQMQDEITGNTTITPSEVEAFYKKIPEDSLPRINATVKISQIVRYPDYTDEAVFEVKERLLELRKRILDGERFSTLAVLYSEGPSASKGGEIGFLGRGELDPAYAKAAFSLKKGAISPIVESEFGYHLIQLIERKDDKVNTRHILLKPKISPVAIVETKNKLDSIAMFIRRDSITFEKAAKYYSQDKDTRAGGGVMINPETGTAEFEMDDFSASDYYIIRDLKENEISEPFESVDQQGKKVYKIVTIRSRTEPHLANLKQDYNYIKELALANKKEKMLIEWIEEKQETTYIEIKENFRNCKFRNKGWQN